MLSCSLAVVLLSSKRGKIEISFDSPFCFFSSILVAANRNLVLKKKKRKSNSSYQMVPQVTALKPHFGICINNTCTLFNPSRCQMHFKNPYYLSFFSSPRAYL